MPGSGAPELPERSEDGVLNVGREPVETGDTPSFPISVLGSRLSNGDWRGGIAPEGVLLKIETPGPSSFRAWPGPGAFSMVRSPWALRGVGRLSDDGFLEESPPAASASGA